LDYGRPSLALDILEEFRAPLVDRFTLDLVNLRIFQAGDFSRTQDGGMILERDALKRYFVEYEKQLTTPLSIEGESLTFRQLFRRQAERLARSLLQGEPYKAFRWSRGGDGESSKKDA
jgi:CRISPR-associated protein Cas1